MKPPDRNPGSSAAWSLSRAAGLLLKAALPVGLLTAAVAVYLHMLATKPEPPRRPPVERVWTVETVVAEPAAYRPRIVGYGTVTAGRQVSLRALVAGEVVAVGAGLREGGTVEAGDPLVQIDSFNYEGAVVEARSNLQEVRAKLQEAQARLSLETAALGSAREQLEIAERDLDRAVQLSRTGSMSAQTLDLRQAAVIERRHAVQSGETTLAIMGAQIDQLEAQVERLDWRLRQAQRNLDDVVLKAPFDAYVGTVAAEVGKLLNVNDAVAVLYDRNQFDVRFALTDAQYGRLIEEGLLDRAVEVHWHVGGAPRSYRAAISRIAPEIAAQRGGVDIYATIEPDEGQAPLRPGAFVEVVLDDRTYPDVVRLPATAVYGTDRLYVVEDGRLAGRAIEIVGYDGAEILARGLKGGERIVLTRITNAGDGLKVEERGRAGAEPAATTPVGAIRPAGTGGNG